VLAPPAVAPDKRTGWLVPPGDAATLAQAIDAALRLAPAERVGLASRARGHAQHFTAQAMQAATLALYDRLLHRTDDEDSFSKR
jgi:glycosyltransferase involved in cell wall biosynthesis